MPEITVNRIPNVLAAVVITTLISWISGFENNKSVDLAQIRSDELHEMIPLYNNTLDELRDLSEDRAAMNNKIIELEDNVEKMPSK